MGASKFNIRRAEFKRFIDYWFTPTPTVKKELYAKKGEVITCVGCNHEITTVITNQDADNEDYQLFQNYPNPFNPSTKIKYSVPESGFVKLSVYNLVGEEVSVLVNEKVDAGIYEVTFSAANLPSGTYFYRLQAGNTVKLKKIVLLK